MGFLNLTSVKKYLTPILWLLGAVLVLPLLKKAAISVGIYKSPVRKEAEALAEIRAMAGSAGARSPELVISDAKKIYNAFGLDVPWYHYRNWYEDEDAVLNVLRTYNSATVGPLVVAYSAVSEGRTLALDCRNYLNSSQYDQVANLF